jgi:hypothetical protein
MSAALGWRNGGSRLMPADRPASCEKPDSVTAAGLAVDSYRANIDGLRAIAILSVLGFHAFPGRCAADSPASTSSS